jgi:para-nitrobenzyl esterase
MAKAIIWSIVLSLSLISCKMNGKKDADTNEISTIVEVEGGTIAGLQSKDSSIFMFKGIPYAAPPVDSLRWKPPAPVIPWEGVKPCEEFAASPIQSEPVPFYMWSEEFLIPKEPIDEDALFLNVWTPAKKIDENLPVLVWIHGGGFSSGGASVPIYDGEALAQKGVVFVGINYRLNLFGFLAHPELTAESPNEASGNYGLLDQIEALKWVQNNIEQFGGNPDNVTIAGQSAGSASVAFLVASPLAKGLFSKAIAQSGAGILPRAPGTGGLGLSSLKEAEQEGVRISNELGEASISELRNIPAAELFKKVRFRGHPIQDGYVLPEVMMNVYQEGRQNPVSLLTGWNEQDGIMMGGFQSANDYHKGIMEQWGELGEELIIHYPATNDSVAKISQNQLQRDLVFGAQNYTMANIISDQGLAVYVYRFARDLPDGEQEDYGAFHTGEVPYAYNNLDVVDRPFEEVDYQLADTMSSYWANFAKSGNPNAEELPEWPKYQTATKEQMIFNKQAKKGAVSDSLQLNFLVSNLVEQNN